MEEAVGLTLGVLQLGGGEACMVGACRVRSCVTSGSRRLRAYSSETMKPVVLKKIKIELETIPQGSTTTVIGGQQVRTSSMVLLVAYAFYRLNVF